MDVVELDALPRRDAVAASRRAEEPAAAEPEPPPLAPSCGCIACQASAGIDRCAVQTFVGAKNSAALIEVMFVGATSWRAADGAVQSRARPSEVRRPGGRTRGACDAPAGYDGNSPVHNEFDVSPGEAAGRQRLHFANAVMARKSQRTVKRSRPDVAASGAPSRPRQQAGVLPASTGPNVPLLGLSVAGMAVAGYLTYTGWTGDRAADREVGGGCDIVQSSQWATFLRVPTAFWGLLLYAALASIAFRVSRPIVQWRRAWVLAFIGWGVSVYLTAISLFVIQATCPYCLGSLGIFTVIMGLLLWQRPEGMPRSGWPKWLLQTAIPAVIVIGALHAQASERTARGPRIRTFAASPNNWPTAAPVLRRVLVSALPGAETAVRRISRPAAVRRVQSRRAARRSCGVL